MKRILIAIVLLLTTTSALAQAPFVDPQPPRSDGSIVHIVQLGDTLDGIVFAYTRYSVTREQLLERNGWRFEPQILVVGEEIIVLPPGSVDPTTGDLIPGGGSVAPAPAEETGSEAPVEAAADVPTPERIAPTNAAPVLPGFDPNGAAVQAISPFLPLE